MSNTDSNAGEPQDVEYSVGTRVRSTREFSGVPKGTEGVVDEDYGAGLMVAWDLPDRPLPDEYDRLPADVLRPTTTGPHGFEIPLLRDGFDKSTELRFLERVEDDQDEVVTDGGEDELMMASDVVGMLVGFVLTVGASAVTATPKNEAASLLVDDLATE